jgi:dTDP-L-rhamnose 4-epimerase
VCSGTPITVGAVGTLLAEAAGGPGPRVTGEYRAGDVRHVVASPELAAEELGFRATIAPAEGIAAFADAPLRD